MQDQEHMEEILELEAVSSVLWPVSLTAHSCWKYKPVKESVFRRIFYTSVLPTHLKVKTLESVMVPGKSYRTVRTFIIKL